MPVGRVVRAGPDASGIVRRDDAIPLASMGPSIVVVTPSVGGLCHHEAEYTAPEDLEAGLHLLTSMLWNLCVSGNRG